MSVLMGVVGSFVAIIAFSVLLDPENICGRRVWSEQ